MADDYEQDLLLIREGLASDTGFIRLKAYIDPVMRSAIIRHRFMRPQHDLDDIAQSLWVWLLNDDRRILRKYDPAYGARLSTWLRVIFDRKIAHIIKQMDDRFGPMIQVPEQVSPMPDAEERLRNQQKLRRLFEAIKERFGERWALIFVLHFVDGHDAATVGRMVKMVRGSVYNAISKLKSFIKAHFDGQAGEASA